MLKNKKENQEEGVSTLANNIGKGTTVEGNIETLGNIRLEGKMIGNLKTKAKFVSAASSKMDGNTLSQNAEIAGEISGTVEVSELLILKSTAVIHGDIITNKLIVESGATFNGACKMGVSIKEIKIGQNDNKYHNNKKAPILEAN